MTIKRRSCVLCGRTGTTNFTDDGMPRCLAARACVKRWHAKRAAASEDPKWRAMQAMAIANVHPTRGTGFTHDCSRGYATEALAEYDLDDWMWLVADLANAMDDAAFDAADEWFALQRPALKRAAHLPRWCPCGRWPDFGTGCYYHGACTCVTWEYHGNLMTCFYGAANLAYSKTAWHYDSIYRRVPVLDRGCPVHPDGPLPADVFARWLVHESLSLSPTDAERAHGTSGSRDDKE